MVYGTEKMNSQWRGQDLAEIKLFWASELGGYSGDELRGGFERLRKEHPEWPPTLYEFAELCRASVKPEAYVALPRPAVDHAAVDPRINELKVKLGQTRHMRDWAVRILEREKAGDKTLWPIAVAMSWDAERVASGGAPRSHA